MLLEKTDADCASLMRNRFKEKFRYGLRNLRPIKYVRTK